MPEKDLNQRFTVQQKMKLVSQSWDLSELDFGRFLRTHGISSPEVDDWRAQMKDGLNNGKPLARNTKKTLEARIVQLEEELNKANGLLELQKKILKITEEGEAIKTPPSSGTSVSKPSKQAKKPTV